MLQVISRHYSGWAQCCLWAGKILNSSPDHCSSTHKGVPSSTYNHLTTIAVATISRSLQLTNPRSLRPAAPWFCRKAWLNSFLLQGLPAQLRDVKMMQRVKRCCSFWEFGKVQLNATWPTICGLFVWCPWRDGEMRGDGPHDSSIPRPLCIFDAGGAVSLQADGLGDRCLPSRQSLRGHASVGA